MFKVEFTEKAHKDILSFDSYTQKILLGWIRKHLYNIDNPRAIGKPLQGDKKGFWRYRVGDYRIITQIIDDKVIILVITIGHRREIYR